MFAFSGLGFDMNVYVNVMFILVVIVMYNVPSPGFNIVLL